MVSSKAMSSLSNSVGVEAKMRSVFETFTAFTMHSMLARVWRLRSMQTNSETLRQCVCESESLTETDSHSCLGSGLGSLRQRSTHS